MGFGIGIDIGGTKCAVILGEYGTDSQDNVQIRGRRAFSTRETGGPEAVIGRFMEIIDGMLEESGIPARELLGIGISCGGPLDRKTGVILSPPNLPGWDNVPIVRLLKARYRIPVALENDANACALAEWKYGAGKGSRSLLFLTFGTGLGMGMILDGRLYRGASDMAGEAGHLRLAECGPVGYGKIGSFEGFCSGGGIAQLAQMKVLEQLGRGEAPALLVGGARPWELTARDVARAAEEGDKTAREIYALSGQYLGKGLSLLIDLLNPEVIVIGSIFARCRELLWPHAREVIERETLAASRQACRVVPAGLGEKIGDYAALSLVNGESGGEDDE